MNNPIEEYKNDLNFLCFVFEDRMERHGVKFAVERFFYDMVLDFKMIHDFHKKK